MKVVLQACSARHPAATPGAAPALRAINLAVASGEQLAAIGPSGAGKTTLLQVMACALRPAHGTAQLDTANPWKLGNQASQGLRKRLFLAPQVPPLPPRQRVVTAVRGPFARHGFVAEPAKSGLPQGHGPGRCRAGSI